MLTHIVSGSEKPCTFVDSLALPRSLCLILIEMADSARSSTRGSQIAWQLIQEG